MISADFQIEHGEAGLVLRLSGDWTTAGLGRASRRLEAALKAQTPARLELDEMGRFDTAGALSIVKATGSLLPASVWAARRGASM